MKLIIDIDDEDYKRIQDIPDVFNSLTSRTYSAIKNGTPLKEWLKSFNTESASVCFNKIQELKGIVGAGSEKNTQGVYDGHITS